MDTLKTGFIVVLLLAVLYGVYVVLNKDQSPPTAEIAWHQQEAEKELQIDVGESSGPNVVPNDLRKDSISAPEKPTTLPVSPASDTKGTSPGDLGIPSVIKAELTPIENPAAKLDLPLSPLRPTTGDPLSAGNQPPQPTTLQGSDGVAPPSLLSNNPKIISNPTIDSKPRSLSDLRPLREPPLETPPVSPESQPTLIPEGPAATPKTPSDPISKSPDFATLPSTDSKPPEASSVPDTVPAESTEVTPPSIKPITTVAAFEAAMREAHTNIEEEKWYQALFLLSKFYNSPDLSSEQHQSLLDLLDPLAAKVVYSQEHLVTDAHIVARGETLTQIANTNQVPVDLIANINGLDKTGVLVPGTSIKIVKGPFRADVDLTKNELTLFAGQLYAGRFPISVGKEPEPQPGEFRVLEKQPGKDYYGSNGQVLRPDDPGNPYGHVWIALGQEIAIHSSPEQGDTANRGCISLSPLDAHDIFSILTEGSSVTIRR